MNIGDVKINGRVFLAPMAGVTDFAFRAVCRELGASLTYTEMISSRALVYQDKKTCRLLDTDGRDFPLAVQIFGSDAEIMAEAARKAVSLSNAALLDINMGCPTPKIVSNGDGCALMRDTKLSEKIIRAVVSAVSIPVTVKIRKGWDESHINAVEFSKTAEAAGAAAICVHGRTRTRMYSGRADWDIIGQAVSAVKIPVVANGDIKSAEDCVKILEHTGAAAAMIGRAALGNPWIFSEANAAISGISPPAPPSLEVRLDTAARQIGLSAGRKGEKLAMLEARRHLAWYLKGIRNAGCYKDRVSHLSSLDEMYTLIDEIKSNRED
ncbi:MAG: tRNA dihydrouridine synthase DusB [Clostridiales bacterium]|nr:tRNA dihydrouridine synthase DusB [Clostridiales bacterium]